MEGNFADSKKGRPHPALALLVRPSPRSKAVAFLDLGGERARKLSIGVHGFAENRENRQTLDRERDRKWAG
jgi:hypothetical protein